MKKLKILHIVSSLNKSSGVMSVIMNYYRNINRNKIQFDFIFFTSKENTYKTEIEQLGGKVYKISSPKKYFKCKNELRYLFENFEGEYKAIHNHEVYLTFLIAPIVKKYGIKNIITHSHTTMYSDRILSSFRNKILCLGLEKRANYYLACSKAAGNFLYKKEFTVLNNAIDCKKFIYNKNIRKEYRELLNLNENFVIGHIGRFSKQKNHGFIIDIFSEILKIRKEAKLLLVGDGGLEEKIKDKVKNMGLENNVLFLGRRKDVSEIVQAMDIFLLPSLYEGLPVVGVEVQASGLPIVMSTEITKEIGIINSHYISLEKPANYWAKKINKINIDVDRVRGYEILQERGYEITREVIKLEEFYFNLK